MVQNNHGYLMRRQRSNDYPLFFIERATVSPPHVGLAPSNDLPIGRTLISPVARDSPLLLGAAACLWPISWSATRRCLAAPACALLTVQPRGFPCTPLRVRLGMFLRCRVNGVCALYVARTTSCNFIRNKIFFVLRCNYQSIIFYFLFICF